ncbi:MAG: hypothetical protein HWE20_08610 [Gammaproteobacteria bacterium]|nr:hypothetical protein [Gammaproteobacteria bacterium]
MNFGIRQNAKQPEIVTDCYLHSMMMAIIVAANEATALESKGKGFRVVAE